MIGLYDKVEVYIAGDITYHVTGYVGDKALYTTTLDIENWKAFRYMLTMAGYKITAKDMATYPAHYTVIYTPEEITHD